MNYIENQQNVPNLELLKKHYGSDIKYIDLSNLDNLSGKYIINSANNAKPLLDLGITYTKGSKNSPFSVITKFDKLSDEIVLVGSIDGCGFGGHRRIEYMANYGYYVEFDKSGKKLTRVPSPLSL
jgi:hypothetical protein